MKHKYAKIPADYTLSFFEDLGIYLAAGTLIGSLAVIIYAMIKVQG